MQNLSIIKLVTTSVCCAILLLSIVEEVVADSGCKVSVRMISGQANADPSAVPEPGLSDILHQLNQLPAKGFKLLESKKKPAPMDELALFKLSSGDSQFHQVSVTPHSHHGDRVKATIDWKGPKGEDYLSTRVSLHNGKSMLFGADGLGGNSTILCVSIFCA